MENSPDRQLIPARCQCGYQHLIPNEAALMEYMVTKQNKDLLRQNTQLEENIHALQGRVEALTKELQLYRKEQNHTQQVHAEVLIAKEKNRELEMMASEAVDQNEGLLTRIKFLEVELEKKQVNENHVSYEASLLAAERKAHQKIVEDLTSENTTLRKILSHKEHVIHALSMLSPSEYERVVVESHRRSRKQGEELSTVSSSSDPMVTPPRQKQQKSSAPSTGERRLHSPDRSEKIDVVASSSSLEEQPLSEVKQSTTNAPNDNRLPSPQKGSFSLQYRHVETLQSHRKESAFSPIHAMSGNEVPRVGEMNANDMKKSPSPGRSNHNKSFFSSASPSPSRHVKFQNDESIQESIITISNSGGNSPITTQRKKHENTVGQIQDVHEHSKAVLQATEYLLEELDEMHYGGKVGQRLLQRRSTSPGQGSSNRPSISHSPRE